MVDIIIPVLNEEEFLKERSSYYKRLGQAAHLIFVDGGSQDGTVNIAREFGEVGSSQRGRALQKNEGARLARSNYLLFLHVDTFVDLDSLKKVELSLSNGVCGGCFTMYIENRSTIFKIFEAIINFRARVFKVLDGDLGQFMRKDVFWQLGGYDNVSVMEDILMGIKLKRHGNVKVLSDQIKVSSRKWCSQGFWKTLRKYFITYVNSWRKR